MQIRPGASVLTIGENEVGRVERIVIDPRTKEITHLVVGSSLLFNDSRIVPVEMISSAESDRVHLISDKESLENLPFFEETHFIPQVEGDETNQVPPMYWYPPVGMTAMGYPGYFAYPYPTHTEQNLPEELVALQDGAKVTDISGEDVGEIEKVIAAGESDKVTHFVVGWGMLQRTRKLFPIHWVESVAQNQVRLAVHKREIKRLPEYQG